jgi:hypothetical protein
MKYLPPELSDWYFPFNWDVKVLWGLSGDLQKRDITKFKWHLEKPFWSSVKGKGLLFDLKPLEVLEDPAKYPYHKNRIDRADTSFSICVTKFKGREIIIDGIHRLAKNAEQNIEVIEVRLVNESSIQGIATYP